MTSQHPKSVRPSRFPIAIAAVIPFMGCSAPSEHPGTAVPGYDQPNNVPVSNSVAQGPCDDGAERKCSVILGKYDGIVSCFVGVQLCTDSVWGPCQDPKTIVVHTGGAGGADSGGAGGANVGGAGGAGVGGAGGSR